MQFNTTILWNFLNKIKSKLEYRGTYSVCYVIKTGTEIKIKTRMDQ